MKVGHTRKQIADSRYDALETIKSILDAGNVEDQFKDRNTSYHGSEKFIVSWLTNTNGFPAETTIDITEPFYKAYSGYGAILCTRTLFYEKQIAGYPDIENALIQVGMQLCPKRDRVAFFNKYAVPYNERNKKSQA
jgi:hypothetical protein